jgi:site-specific recombinase XerD
MSRESKVSEELIHQPDNNLIDTAITAWLHAKTGRSNSKKTAIAYRDTLLAFRSVLQNSGLDLTANPTLIALTAQGWAGQGQNGEMVSPATFNQRLAILSSFYAYALKQSFISTENPLRRVERRPTEHYASASPLELDRVKTLLAQIDRSTLEGKRDYALLTVYLQTGRRLSEVAGLRMGDLVFGDNDKLTFNWKRVKGGKSMRDTVAKAVSRVMLDWLSACYGQDYVKLGEGKPIWVSLSYNNQGGALSIQAIADICKARLGTSKVHSLRHTFAYIMEESGAKVSDIQARLGHKSLATTGIYLAALRTCLRNRVPKVKLNVQLTNGT